MDLGAFTSGLLTGLREGVEAALIVSIILAYLAKTGNRAALPEDLPGRRPRGRASSVFIGATLWLTVGGFEEPYEQIFEGLTMLVAAGVVTWMLFWMRRQASSVKGELQAAVDRALDDGSATAPRRSSPSSPSSARASRRRSSSSARWPPPMPTRTGSSIGALVGLAIAVLIGVGFYQGSRRVNLRHVLPLDRDRARVHRGRPAEPRASTSSSRSASSRSGRRPPSTSAPSCRTRATAASSGPFLRARCSATPRRPSS